MPSTRYTNAVWRNIKASGGHDGPHTRREFAARLATLHANGLTAKAAADVLSSEYKLYSALQNANELLDTPKRPPGRPPGTTKPIEAKAVRVNVTMAPGQHDKFKQLGGSAWLRQQIDKAK